MATRPPSFDLTRAITAAGFTPARDDLPGLFELLAHGDETVVGHAGRALQRIDASLVTEGFRARLAEPGAMSTDAAVHAIALLAGLARAHPGCGATELLVDVLGDQRFEPRRRRAAVIGLGKVGGAAAEHALLAYWDGPMAPPERRAATEALGKIGGEGALARLTALDPGGDGELARRRARALLMLERGRSRPVVSEVDLTAPPPVPISARAHCRGGLEPLLRDELAEHGIRASAGPRGLTFQLEGGLDAVWKARTLLGAGLVVPRPGGELAASIVEALCAEPTRALLRALTRGPIRWRLDIVGEGHRRGLVWKVAHEVAKRCPDLVNDPTDTTWQVSVDPAGRDLELVPRRFTDPRFEWRVADVPAASHPTIAAALARVAGVRDDDVVWDPFVGSGAELVERSRLGPSARLIGTDLDARALEAARANARAAGINVELSVADACEHDPGGVTLIITNPPLGRRLRGDAPALLDRFLAHAGRVLAPGGRLVWVSPVPRRTERAALHAGLTLDRRLTVDLGGFDAAMERWIRQ